MEFKSHATFHMILDGDRERELIKQFKAKAKAGWPAGDG